MSIHTGDIKSGTPVSTLPRAWRCRVWAETGLFSVSTRSPGETASLTGSFYLSAATRTTVLTEPPLRYTSWDINILFYSRLCPSTTGSSPPPESSTFLCPLLSLSIPLLVAPQCHLSNDVLVFRLILHPLPATLCF